MRENPDNNPANNNKEWMKAKLGSFFFCREEESLLGTRVWF